MSTALCLLVALLAAPGPNTTVGEVAGRTVKLSELDKAAGPRLKAAQSAYEQQVYEARKAALDELIDNALLETEAKRRKLPNAAALLSALAREVSPPGEGDVRAFYQANQDRMQGAAFEEVAPRIQEHLYQQMMESRRGALIASLRQAGKVRVTLSPPRISVEAKGVVRGPAKAPVTVVMFGDFQCPYCARGADSVEEVRKRHTNEVRLVHRDYPLPFHQEAVPAAIAARCAGRQGKYWEAHDALYKLYDQLGDQTYPTVARQLGLNLQAFDSCRRDPAIRAEIDADAKAGAAAGVEGTPAFFINGIRISGALPPDDLDAVVTEELARARGKN